MTDVSSLDTAQRSHHPHSPSSLQASEACPCFVNEQRTSAAAEEGTLCHKAVETRDLTVLDGDEELELAAQKAIDYEDELLSKLRLSGTRFEVVREVYLSVGDESFGGFKGITGGFPDTLLVAEKSAILIDHKFGRVPVTPTKDNLQGIAYSLGVFEKYPGVESVEVHFFAPRQGWTLDEQRKKYVHTFHRRDKDALELRVRTVVARKIVAQAAVARGDWSAARAKHDMCLWCSRKADCPAVAQIVAATVSKYHDLVVPEEVKEYRLDTPDKVAQAYRFANQLQTICEAVKKRCIDAAVQDGLLPEGFSVIKSSRREVVNPRRFLELAIDAGLTEEEAVNLINIPLTTFENAIKAKAPKGKGAPAVRAFAAALAENGATQQGKEFYFLREQKSPADKSDGVISIS